MIVTQRGVRMQAEVGERFEEEVMLEEKVEEGAASRSWKRPGIGFLPGAAMGNAASPTPISALLTSRPRENTSVLFVAICSSIDRELTLLV